MVNMEVVKERALKGAYVGAGSFASSFAATLIEEQFGTGDIGTSVAQVGTGLAISVGVDEVFQNTTSIPNQAVEFAGYGIQGAGFSNLAESIQTGEAPGRVVSVQSNAASQQTQAQQTSSNNSTQAYSLDTA